MDPFYTELPFWTDFIEFPPLPYYDRGDEGWLAVLHKVMTQRKWDSFHIDGAFVLKVLDTDTINALPEPVKKILQNKVMLDNDPIVPIKILSNDIAWHRPMPYATFRQMWALSERASMDWRVLIPEAESLVERAAFERLIEWGIESFSR
jgi:hypothetical protein